MPRRPKSISDLSERMSSSASQIFLTSYAGASSPSFLRASRTRAASSATVALLKFTFVTVVKSPSSISRAPHSGALPPAAQANEISSPVRPS